MQLNVVFLSSTTFSHICSITLNRIKYCSGIPALTKLKKFRFQHTRLNDEKLRILTLALVALPSLEILELLYCNLSDNSGLSMGHLLQHSPTIKSLNLKGNQLQAIGCQGIGYGLQQRLEPLEFLGKMRIYSKMYGLHK